MKKNNNRPNMFKLLLVCLGCIPLLLPVKARAQGKASAQQYRQAMMQLYQSVQQHCLDTATGLYKEIVPEKGKAYSYLWPLCGLLQAGNEMEKTGVNIPVTANTWKAIQLYYDTVTPPVPGYASYVMKEGGGTRFYDDNQWIGIALMDAYFRTGQKAYLEKGKEIYRFMMSGYDTVTGGGLYWEEGKLTSKNTCSNAPGVVLALQLYKASKNKSYLDTALLLYNWVNKNLQSPQHLYYDNIRIPQRTIDQHIYSYNTGAMMQAGVYLFELTGEKQYLSAATAMAASAEAYFYSKGTFRDSYWFNAVLLRGLQQLAAHADVHSCLEAFERCTDDALLHREAGLMTWKGKTTDLVGQAGMLEILARLAFIEKQKQ